MPFPTVLPRTAVLLAVLTAGSPLPAAPLAVPGFNVHAVEVKKVSRILRGGAPTRATLEALARSARERGVRVTLFDLRSPANADDRSGKGGRLAPAAEAAMAAKLGIGYVRISALDRELVRRIQEARREGDVYFHCMYGVNRTGFAAGRLACASGESHPTVGTGKRDWAQGVAFEKARRGTGR